MIMEKEAGNPEFGFLYNLASPEHAYYRWRLFSLSQGAPHAHRLTCATRAPESLPHAYYRWRLFSLSRVATHAACRT